jgi:hypothetical protein
MDSGYFNEHHFQQRVNTALERVRTILDNTRTPEYPSEVQHEYEDKYLLSEFLANSTIASHLSSFESLGLSAKPFSQLKEWATTRSVSLRLQAEEQCKFLKKETRDVESDTKNVRFFPSHSHSLLSLSPSLSILSPTSLHPLSILSPSPLFPTLIHCAGHKSGSFRKIRELYSYKGDGILLAIYCQMGTFGFCWYWG